MRGGFGQLTPAALDDFGGDAPGRPRLLLSDGERHVVLSEPDAALLAASMPSQVSDEWRRLAASLLCEFVLPKLIGVPDTDPRVAYHHSRDDAIRRAQETGGVALLLPSAALSDVLTLAARGERMPRKSTSFGPKPRTGLLMRLLDE